MKRLIIFTILSIGILQNAQTQIYPKEFGRVSKEEIELKKYAKDPNAEALVLYDIGKSYFVEANNNFDVVFERVTRIKILTEAGIKWAEVEIPYYREDNIFEKVYEIEAYAYNLEDGMINKTPVQVSNTFDEKINNNWNLKKFAIPNVRAGTVIEYRYKLSSEYKFNLRDWEFQWRIPVVYSEYEVKMIPYYEYTYLMQGAKKFDVYQTYLDKSITRRVGPALPYANNEYNDLVFKFGMKDLPAFNDFEFITSINDYIIKLDFQLSAIRYPGASPINILTTWESMVKDLLKNPDFGKYINKSSKLAPKLFDVKSMAGKSKKEIFNLVLNYVKGNFNWDKTNSKYASKSPNALVKEKIGNNADINLFTIGLLNSFGIEAHPVLISTRNNGKIKNDYPFVHFFNYVIIHAIVDDEIVLTDATDVLNQNNRIPIRCINDKGLLVKKGPVEWFGLDFNIPSEISTFIGIDFNNDLELKASIKKSYTEYEALYYRNFYGSDKEIIKKKIDSKGFTIIDSSICVQNYLEIENPYIINYNISSSPEIINDKIYIPPFINNSISENPLKQNERKYPIDLIYPLKRVYKTVLKIPVGYQVDFTPNNQSINNNHFQLNYTVSIDNDLISIDFDYLFKKSKYSPDEYFNLKFYFNEVVKKGTEKIVLSKKQ
jgi:hypothetical protein